MYDEKCHAEIDFFFEKKAVGCITFDSWQTWLTMLNYDISLTILDLINTKRVYISNNKFFSPLLKNVIDGHPNIVKRHFILKRLLESKNI